MITDNDNNELTYWPISGLIEGEDSEVLNFTVTAIDGSSIVATEDDRVIVWVRKVGDPTYVNLTEVGSYVLTAGEHDMQMYIEALSPIEAFERVPISLVCGSATSAGWDL